MPGNFIWVIGFFSDMVFCWLLSSYLIYLTLSIFSPWGHSSDGIMFSTELPDFFLRGWSEYIYRKEFCYKKRGENKFPSDYLPSLSHWQCSRESKKTCCIALIISRWFLKLVMRLSFFIKRKLPWLYAFLGSFRPGTISWQSGHRQSVLMLRQIVSAAHSCCSVLVILFLVVTIVYLLLSNIQRFDRPTV